eukprot:7996278-Lingulodinium_polyedra.AAC.1
MRLRIWGVALTLAKLRYPAVAWLNLWAPLIADAHADYMLGERVRSLECKGPDGAVLARPLWPL